MDTSPLRSPLVIRWPGKISGGKKVAPTAAAIDLLPTLADLAGIDVASKKPLDGISLKPLLAAQADGEVSKRDRMIFSHWRGRVSVRTQQFRLDHQGKLYDMVKDPGQYNDGSKDVPAVAARLRAAAKQWKTDVLSQLGKSDRPFLIGHVDYQYTQLPARDAIPHGNIKRSNRFPNCSFFTNWTSEDDKITWDAKVAVAGDYEVEVYYTCPKAHTGSTIELSFNGSRIHGQITKPHNPPIRGDENDRVERRESYVKDFQPLRLGTIRLEAGRGELTLRALKVAGQQVADFRLIMLRRVAEK